MKIPSDMFCIFICENTHKVLCKIFEIDFEMNLNNIRPFDPSPGSQGAGPTKSLTSHDPFMSVTHTPNLVEFRPMV